MRCYWDPNSIALIHPVCVCVCVHLLADLVHDLEAGLGELVQHKQLVGDRVGEQPVDHTL